MMEVCRRCGNEVRDGSVSDTLVALPESSCLDAVMFLQQPHGEECCIVGGGISVMKIYGLPCGRQIIFSLFVFV